MNWATESHALTHSHAPPPARARWSVMALLRGWLVVLALLPGALSAGMPVSAQETAIPAVEAPLPDADAEAVQSATEALKERGDFNWYGKETDSVERIHLLPQKATTTPSPTPPSNWGGGWSGFGWGASLGQILAWGLLVLALTVLAMFLVMAFLRREDRAVDLVQQPKVTRSDAARLESLPFKVEEPATDLLTTARRHWEAGDFDRAIIYLYSHQLMALDEHQWIYLNEGTTNRQYLRQLPRGHRLREILDTTIVAFEGVFFGHHPLSRAGFNECWKHLPEFDLLLPRRTP